MTIHRQDLATCSCPVFTFNSSCPRFAAFPLNYDGGIGHRVSELLMGWHMAVEMNLTYVFIDDHFLKYGPLHKGYWWGEQMFHSIVNQYPLYSVVRSRYHPREETVCPYQKVSSESECNIIYNFGDGCCSNGDCFQSADMLGLFDRYKSCIRCNQQHGFLFDPHLLNIVWHLRIGDAELHSGDITFFLTVWRTLYQVLQAGEIPARNIFVFEHPNAGTASQVTLPTGFTFLHNETLFPNVTLLPTETSYEALVAFTESDILIGTGSSFTDFAALTSNHFLYLQHDPKHGYHNIESLADAIRLYPNGTVDVTPAELRVLVHAAYCRKKPLSKPKWFMDCAITE